jgi:EsV-1-7 cysteine-rich motif
MSHQLAQFCFKHKEAAMVDVRNPRCVMEGCSTLATFGLSTSKVSTNQQPARRHACASTVQTDLIHSTNCWPHYCCYDVLLTQAKLYCAQHAAGRDGIVNRSGVACCRNEACSKLATFGHRGQRAMYCKACIPAELKGTLTDVKTKRCELGGCTAVANCGFKPDRVSAISLSD